MLPPTPGWAEAGVKRQTHSRWIALKRSLSAGFHGCWVRPSEPDPAALTLVTNPAETRGATLVCKHCQIQRAALTSTLQRSSHCPGCAVKGKDGAGKGKQKE